MTSEAHTGTARAPSPSPSSPEVGLSQGESWDGLLLVADDPQGWSANETLPTLLRRAHSTLSAQQREIEGLHTRIRGDDLLRAHYLDRADKAEAERDALKLELSGLRATADERYVAYVHDMNSLRNQLSAATARANQSKEVMKIALCVLSMAEHAQDWSANFAKDIAIALEGLRSITAEKEDGDHE